MLERYNTVSLKTIQDSGAKLDAGSKGKRIPHVAGSNGIRICYVCSVGEKLCFVICYGSKNKPTEPSGLFAANLFRIFGADERT